MAEFVSKGVADAGQSKYYANDVETIKNAYKALYYLLSIEKNK